MHLFDKPWLQMLLYLVQSIFMLAFIRNQRPFDNARTNFLESFNELSVLISGYHMILISGFEIEYTIRNRIGTSLIIWLTFMILLNFVLWMSTTVRNVKLSCRKLRY